MTGDVFSGGIHTGMIGPLIENGRGAALFIAADYILGNNRYIKAVDELVNAVIDFGVNVIGTAGQYDDTLFGGTGFFNNTLAEQTYRIFSWGSPSDDEYRQIHGRT